MKRALALLPIIVLLAFLPNGHAAVPVINPPTSGVTTFWDDFVTSQFPSQWSPDTQLGLYNSTQQGGYLVSTIWRNAEAFASFYQIGLTGNNTSPALPSQNSSFTQIIFKLQAFNITNLSTISQTGALNPQNTFTDAELKIGLVTTVFGNPGLSNSIYFDLLQANKPLSQICTCPAQKQAVLLSVKGGPAAGGTTFLSGVIGGAGTQPAIAYNGGNSPIDLNAQHIFTLQVNTNITNPTNEWARFRVDNFAWTTFWQSSCSCLGTTFPVFNLFPFIQLTTDDPAGVGNPPYILSQSVAVQVDYVLATNYLPATLPAGQLLSSNINPPTVLPQPYNPNGPTGSLPAFFQYYASKLGGGNIYAGGYFLAGIIVVSITASLGVIVYRTRRGIRELGFMWSLSALGISFFFLYCGIVPLLLPVVQTIVSAGIIMGVVKTGDSSGGVVPD